MKKRIVSAILSLLMLAMPVWQSMAYAAAGTLIVTADRKSAVIGETVDVDVRIKNNPGIIGAALLISFDDELTLVDASLGEAFRMMSMTKPGAFTSPCRFVWDTQSLSEEDIVDGVILTLTFKVSDKVHSGDSFTVGVEAERDSFVTGTLKKLQPTTSDGRVDVYDYAYGDVNDDGKINMTDVILMRRHMAGGYGVTINEEAADVDLDGKPFVSDLVVMRQYIAGGYGIDELPYRSSCDHLMEEFPYKAPTTEEAGHIAYWYCHKCDRYFSDADGEDEITLEDTILAPLAKQYTIKYHIGDNDSYLRSISDSIVNNNPSSYNQGETVVLQNLNVEGYRFGGWFTRANGGGQEIERIKPDEAGDYELYAYLTPEPLTVTFEASDFTEQSEATRYINKALALPSPTQANFIFVGWIDQDGNLYKKNSSIPVGTAGDLVLTPQWTSQRYQTWTITDPHDPIIVQDDEAGVILFTYEIGQVDNVPLDVIHDFGYITEGGINRTETTDHTIKTSSTLMDSYTKALSKATTESSNWTLSDEWSDTTDVSDEWCEEHGMTKEEARSVSQNDTSNWNISNSVGGSHATTVLDSTETTRKAEVKTTKENEWSVGAKVASKLSVGAKIPLEGVKLNVGGEVSSELSGSYKQKNGIESTYSQSLTDLHSESNTSNFSWNNSASYGGSRSVTQNQSISNTLSEKISEKHNYGTSYTKGGKYEDSQGLSSTTRDDETYSNAVTYVEETTEKITSSWTTTATKKGYHRWVVAGIAHVFGVVGYDISSNSFFTYTYSVMDDQTYQYEDYSTVATYDDYQNGVISFSIPAEIRDYVAEYTYGSPYLMVDQNTGLVTGYTGTDEECVYIPEYWRAKDGTVIKIVGFGNTTDGKGVFEGRTNIKMVVLSDYMTEIPANTFKGCSSLLAIAGGSITKIGANAFAGCTSMGELGIHVNVTELGENAFTGVDTIYVNAANAQVAKNAAESGARHIYLYLNNVNSAEANALNGKTFTIPQTTQYFELNGYNQTFANFVIDSYAGETYLNKMTLQGTDKTPLRVHSSKLKLNDVTVISNGFAMVLYNEVTEIGLQGTSTVKTNGVNAILSKGMDLSLIDSNIVGLLSVTGKVLVCGDVVGKQYLSPSSFEVIDEQQYARYLTGYTLFFNANGGVCNEDQREMMNSTELGTLPTATREHYTFQGWYTKASGGTKVTASTVFSSGEDVTIYAHWKLHSFTVAWETAAHCTITVTRTSSPYGKAATGALTSGSTVYYGDVLSVSYTADSGYSITSRGLRDIVVDRNYTAADIYCSTGGNSYTYDIVYQSSNGALLGSTTATYGFNTTHTITAPEKPGYTTPDAQTVKWDSTSAKTITFVYTPVELGTQTLIKDAVWWKPSSGNGIRYTVKVSFSNRTETSVQATVTWSNTCLKSSYFGYKQYFNFGINGYTTGDTTICSSSEWASKSSSNRTKTVSKTFTVEGLTADMNSAPYFATPKGSYSSDKVYGTVTIPTY